MFSGTRKQTLYIDHFIGGGSNKAETQVLYDRAYNIILLYIHFRNLNVPQTIMLWSTFTFTLLHFDINVNTFTT